MMMCDGSFVHTCPYCLLLLFIIAKDRTSYSLVLLRTADMIFSKYALDHRNVARYATGYIDKTGI
jgi:hypothetical protein